jgi:hypothetical protein
MRRLALLLCFFGLAVCREPAAARAQVILYSDITNFTGFGVTHGLAANVGGDNITSMLADDITTAPGSAGLGVTQFVFSVLNINTSATLARPLVRFYAADGASGGPGTFLVGINFNPISFTAGAVSLFQATSSTPLFNVPANGQFWAGLTFDDNNGTTGATLAALNNLGEGIFNPPTVGSSADLIFASTSAGSFAGSNPAGSLVTSPFGGAPVANFAWRFVSIPEPSPLVLGGCMLMCAVCGRLALVRNRLAGDQRLAG